MPFIATPTLPHFVYWPGLMTMPRRQRNKKHEKPTLLDVGSRTTIETSGSETFLSEEEERPINPEATETYLAQKVIKLPRVCP